MLLAHFDLLRRIGDASVRGFFGGSRSLGLDGSGTDPMAAFDSSIRLIVSGLSPAISPNRIQSIVIPKAALSLISRSGAGRLTPLSIWLIVFGLTLRCRANPLCVSSQAVRRSLTRCPTSMAS